MKEFMTDKVDLAKRAITSRLEKVRSRLDEAHLDALVIATRPNSFYFTLFDCSNSIVVITANKAWFFTDFRYIEAAEKNLSTDHYELVKLSPTGGMDDLWKVLSGSNIRRIGFEESAPYSFFRKLRQNISQETEVAEAGSIIAPIRAVKDPNEIETIRLSQKINEEILSTLLTIVQSERITEEKQIQIEIRRLIIDGGVEEAFPTIVACGKNSSLPHAVPGKDRVACGEALLIDMGVIYEHYCSDMTRTFFYCQGDSMCLSKAMRTLYNIVLEAQEAALQKVAPGVSACEVDKAARAVIAAHGYGDFFGHGLGHGVGIEIHEAPTLNPASKDILEAGMVITIEPGIYLPNVGGVRIEDLVVVTENGYLNLTRFPKSLQDSLL